MGSRGVSSVAMAVAVLLLAVAVMAPGAAAQPACAQKLIPCANYLGTTTTPPDSCCGQIKEAVQNDLPCLCSIFNNKALLQAFKINVTQALELPGRCGVSSNTNVCSSTTAAAGAPSAPPATPGKDGNTATVARLGASGLVALLAFWWSVVA